MADLCRNCAHALFSGKKISSRTPGACTLDIDPEVERVVPRGFLRDARRYKGSESAEEYISRKSREFWGDKYAVEIELQSGLHEDMERIRNEQNMMRIVLNSTPLKTIMCGETCDHHSPRQVIKV